MWDIEILFGGVWRKIAYGFPTQDNAEWAIAGWKARHDCLGDPFRVVQAVQVTGESMFPTPHVEIQTVSA